MRKSERLRILELQMVRLEMQMEILTGAINSILESASAPAPMHAESLDAQKWHTRNTEE